MIQSTFCHLQGIGPATERRLWAAGVDSWSAAARSDRRLPRVGPLAAHGEASLEALAARDWAYFRGLLGGAHAWRWYAQLRHNAVYLDIETTGLAADHAVVTVVGCWDGRELRMFVRDDNLHQLWDYLAGFGLLVTFNGTTFDVPFLRATRPGLRLPPVHLDLRYALRALELRGGLKSIERQVGLAREDELQAVDGYLAVLLWHRHQAGDPRALPTLLRYCAEDVVGLQPLAELAYERHCALLPPLPIERLSIGERPETGLDWAPEIVEELLGYLTAY